MTLLLRYFCLRWAFWFGDGRAGFIDRWKRCRRRPMCLLCWSERTPCFPSQQQSPSTIKRPSAAHNGALFRVWTTAPPCDWLNELQFRRKRKSIYQKKIKVKSWSVYKRTRLAVRDGADLPKLWERMRTRLELSVPEAGHPCWADMYGNRYFPKT